MKEYIGNLKGQVKQFDVIVAGGGPAGAACATVCARGGLSVLILDRAKFPRDKVCGDNLNPACWPVLDRLGIAGDIPKAPHSRYRAVEIATIHGRKFRFDLPPGNSGQTGIRRRDLDAILLDGARDSGAEVLEKKTVTRIEPGWKIESGRETFSSRWLVAADGRNSTIARLLGLLPPAGKDRIAVQTHVPILPEDEGIVRMMLWPEGYSGGASIGNGLWNQCLVARPEHLSGLKTRASSVLGLPSHLTWNAITPLARVPCFPLQHGGALLLAGDAARVVEPFTGEGIYYALRSGELAGECLVESKIEDYPRLHAALYRKRLWVNQIARQAVLHPVLASRILENLPGSHWILSHLTRRVIPNDETLPRSAESPLRL